jgi:RimJ/RimL family protein N-acetyltransferase
MQPATTSRLTVRELTHDDAPFIRELVNDPAWLRFIGDRNVHSDEAARGYIDKVRDGGYAKHGFGLWRVESSATGEPLGLAGLLRRDWLEHVDVGFAFLERHRGRGYAREAVAAVLELARTRFGLARVVAIATTDNVASHRVLEAAGFRLERLVREPGTGDELNLFARELAS